MTRSRLDKAERLAAAATLPGERDAALAAAARIRANLAAEPAEQEALAPLLPPDLTPAEESEVRSHLASLGYELVPEAESRLNGRLHRRLLETDDQIHGLTRYLLSATPLRRLGSQEAAAFMRKLLAGKRVCEPLTHPSGLRTGEPAYVVIQPAGAGMASPIRSRP